MVAKSYSLNFGGYWRERDAGNVPPVSGVYGVYAAKYNQVTDSVTLHRLIYIGEAENVRNRIITHEKWQKWRQQLRMGEEVCFNVAPIGPAPDRERAEAAMIFKHKPPCNVQYVNEFPYDQTTITTQGRNALMSKRFTVYRTHHGAGVRSLTGMRRW